MNILELHLQEVSKLVKADTIEEVEAIVDNPKLCKGIVTQSLWQLLRPEYAPVIVASRLYVNELCKPEPSQEVLDIILANPEVGNIGLIESIQNRLARLQTGIYDPGINWFVNNRPRPTYPRFPNNTLDLSKLNLDGAKIDHLWMGDVIAFDVTKSGYHLDEYDMFGINERTHGFDYPDESKEFYKILNEHKVKLKVIYPNLSKTHIKRTYRFKNFLNETYEDIFNNILLVTPKSVVEYIEELNKEDKRK